MRRLVSFGSYGLAGLFKNNHNKNIKHTQKKYEQRASQSHIDQPAIDSIQESQNSSKIIFKKKKLDINDSNKSEIFNNSNQQNKQEQAVAKYIQEEVHINQPITLVNQQSSSNKLKLLLQQRTQMLESADFLSAYCDKISALLNKESFEANQKELSQINRKLNDLSFDLTSSPQQYLSILNYRYKCRLFESKFSEVDNYKFIHKATVVCQMLIHKKQLELNQVIFVMQALLKMGSLTVILLMNFTKYIKNMLQDDKQKNKISLEHVLTILNMGVIKRNEITLQNILYDQVLHFLLRNMNALIRDKPIWMKVQTLNLMLVIDIKRFYKIDRKSKEVWTKMLFRDILQLLDGSWLTYMFQNTISSQQSDRLNWRNVLAIVEAINFAHQNKLQELIYEHQCIEFINNIISTICQSTNNNINVQQLSEDKKMGLLRMIFNSKSWALWSTNPQQITKIKQFILFLQLTNRESFLPLVDLISHSKHHSSKDQHARLMALAHHIYSHYSKAISLYALQLSLYQNGIHSISKQLQAVKEQQTNNLADRLTLYILDAFYKQSNHNVSINQLEKLFDRYSQKQRAKNLIVACHEIAIKLRNYAIVLPLFELMFNLINTKNAYWQKMKQSNLINQENRLLLELLLNATINGHHLSPQLNQIMLYLFKENNLRNSFINRCYPPTYSFANLTKNQYNIFTDCENFTHKFYKLQQLYQDEKYSFYCWDLLIKQLPRLSLASRRQAYPLVQRVFLNAFEKDNLRKVVLLTVFTNHICSNTIIADQQTFKRCINRCIDDLIKAEEIIEYHYQCYVQIVINLLSCDLLQLQTFNTIMKHTYQKSPEVKETTTLLLLYGSTIYKQTGMDKEKEKVKIQSQRQYLKMLINKNHLVQQTCEAEAEVQRRDSVQNGKQKFGIYISGRMIAMYLRFGIKQMLKIERLVFKYVRQCVDYTQWQLIARSYHPQRFQNASQKQQQFLRNLSSHIKQKLPIFIQKQLLTTQQCQQLSHKLQ